MKCAIVISTYTLQCHLIILMMLTLHHSSEGYTMYVPGFPFHREGGKAGNILCGIYHIWHVTYYPLPQHNIHSGCWLMCGRMLEDTAKNETVFEWPDSSPKYIALVSHLSIIVICNIRIYNYVARTTVHRVATVVLPSLACHPGSCWFATQ